MRPRPLVLAVALILLITAHRLPAPVQEEPDTTPLPSPTVAKPVKPPPKAQTAAKKTESKAKPTVAPSPRSRIAGTWVGTMQTFPAGNQSTVITIDPAQTTMTVDWFGQHGSAKAQIEGDTVRATFPPPAMQPESHKWELTPQPDGLTARVHFRCFMNDFTAIFHRTGSDGR